MSKYPDCCQKSKFEREQRSRRAALSAKRMQIAWKKQQQCAAASVDRASPRTAPGKCAARAARRIRRMENSPLAHLAEDQRSDEKAGDDEENVDADKAAAKAGNAKMVQNHRQHGDRRAARRCRGGRSGCPARTVLVCDIGFAAGREINRATHAYIAVARRP